MLKGKIVKGIAGFYYVHVVGSGIYECKAKGIFRKEGIKPLVGDDVEMEITDEKDMEGNIIQILPRKNALIRPAVANVDQALVVFAAAFPDPNLNLLDRFLLTMECQDIPSVICFNKEDLVTDQFIDELRAAYEGSGYPVLFCCAETGEGVDAVFEQLKGKTTTVAGPSGAGKSTFINRISPEIRMETGEVSEKIKRGRHTTRHAQLIPLGEDSYIVDTPGFTALSIEFLDKEDLGPLFPEFTEPERYCRFAGCSHISEPDCGVKDALAEGRISRSRYENYKQFYRELSEKRKY